MARPTAFRKTFRRAGDRRKRSARRRYAVKKRTYRRKMSSKAILNVTSKKKWDARRGVTNTTATGAPSGLNFTNTTVPGGQTSTYLYCPTYIPAVYNSATTAPIQHTLRSASTCFMRGYSETLRIQTSSGAPWFHRRICFTAKNEAFFTPTTSDTPLINPTPYFISSSGGATRMWLNQQNNAMSNTINNQQGYIFQGAKGVDWDDPITAKVDNTRVDIRFDKTWTYKSGNAVGTVVTKKLWHGMNKNLYYDDSESGAAIAVTNKSVLDKRGMGDYFIYDIFSTALGATATDLLALNSEGIQYWREK